MKVYVHILIWIGVLILLTFSFTPSYNSLAEAFYFVSMLLPVVVGTCYFFNLYLVPRYLLTKRYPTFILYSVYMLVVSLYLEMLVIYLSLIFLAQYSYGNMSPVSSNIFLLAITLYFVVLLFSFVLLIQRSLNKEKMISTLEEEKRKSKMESFSVRSDRQMKTILTDQVSYIESMADYVKIHLTTGEAVLTKERISKLGDRLPETFVRIHRSFIVHQNNVTSFSKESVRIADQELPISRSYKNTAWSSFTDGNTTPK